MQYTSFLGYTTTTMMHASAAADAAASVSTPAGFYAIAIKEIVFLHLSLVGATNKILLLA